MPLAPQHPLSTKPGTYKTVKARFWPWRSGKCPENFFCCFILARKGLGASLSQQGGATDRGFLTFLKYPVRHPSAHNLDSCWYSYRPSYAEATGITTALLSSELATPTPVKARLWHSDVFIATKETPTRRGKVSVSALLGHKLENESFIACSPQDQQALSVCARMFHSVLPLREKEKKKRDQPGGAE